MVINKLDMKNVKAYTEKEKHDSVASGKEWFMSED